MDNSQSSIVNYFLALISSVLGFLISPENLHVIGIIVMPIVVLLLGKACDIGYQEWKRRNRLK